VIIVYIVNDFNRLGFPIAPAVEPRHGKGRSVGGAPATAFPGTWAPMWGRHRNSLMQQLGAAARFGPVGEIIRRPNHAHIKRSGRGRGLQARRRFDEESRRKRGGHRWRIAQAAAKKYLRRKHAHVNARAKRFARLRYWPRARGKSALRASSPMGNPATRRQHRGGVDEGLRDDDRHRLALCERPTAEDMDSVFLFAMAADGNHLRPRGRRTHAYANEDEDTRFIARR